MIRSVIDEDGYCADALTWINAVRAAFHKVQEQIRHDHVTLRVAGAMPKQKHNFEGLAATTGGMAR